MTKEDILNKAHSLSEKAEVVGKIMPKSSIIAASIDMAEWVLNNLWKPADGDDLPEIDKEVIALLDNGKVVFSHRPNPEGWDAKSIITEKVERYIPETYGKGGWNIPDVKWWLDCSMPKGKRTMSKGCGIEFPHFGATYPDAVCIDGYLYDMDSWDGSSYFIGGDEPCPVCNTDEWLKLVLENGQFETKEEALDYVEQLKKRYLNYE